MNTKTFTGYTAMFLAASSLQLGACKKKNTDAGLSAASEDADRMEAVAQKLRLALGDLLKLAEILEASATKDETGDEVRALIKAAAQRLIDGQGDLFTAQEF